MRTSHIRLCSLACLSTLALIASDFDQEGLNAYKNGIAQMAAAGSKLKKKFVNPAVRTYVAENARLSTVNTPRIACMFDLPTRGRIDEHLTNVQRGEAYETALAAYKATPSKETEKIFGGIVARATMASLKREGVIFPENCGNREEYHTQFLQENRAISDTAKNHLVPGSFLLFYAGYILRRATADTIKDPNTGG